MRVCECGAGITCLSFSMVLQCQVCGCEIEVFYFFLCKCKFCECWCAFVLWNWRAPYVKSAQARSEVSLGGYKARPICVCLHFGRGLSAHDSKSSHLVNPFTAKFMDAGQVSIVLYTAWSFSIYPAKSYHVKLVSCHNKWQFYDVWNFHLIEWP